jgi:hypothetical protein
MIWKTFNDWSAEGYKIKKGSKATWFEGVAKFNESQVVQHIPRLRRKWRSAEGPWDWADEMDPSGDPSYYGDS